MGEKIKYYDIESVLHTTSHLTSIQITRWGDKQTVYLTRITNNGIWAKNQYEEQNIRIWPHSHNIQILKIGAKKVQSYKEFLEEKADYYDALNCMKREKKHKMYLDAYRRAKILGGD